MANSSKNDTDTIFEQKVALMISPIGNSSPVSRKSHFLKPTLSTINELKVLETHRSNLADHEVPQWDLKVYFNGWRYPEKDWKSRVSSMHLKHETTWRKTGIHEAIMNSTYSIRRDTELVLALAEKWHPETNTFIFPWGEATITLEDMKVLGGYDALGESVMKQFRGSGNGNESEHVSFLVMWLSRFVFPDRSDSSRKSVYHIAHCLARGINIVLGPAVLASIYRDLSLLKATIGASTKLDLQNERDDAPSLGLWAPFQLVQVWIWERFIKLRPNPNLIQPGEPRFAKWDQDRTNKQESGDFRLAFNSAADSFRWRLFIPALECYADRERSYRADMFMDEELQSFVRCIRTSELVGLDCIEQYLPHRVARQFGFDQDLPAYVPRSNGSFDIAWSNYTRPVTDVQLYIPAKLFEPDVTVRYLEWWKPLLFARQDAIKCVFQKKRSPRSSAKRSGETKVIQKQYHSQLTGSQRKFTPFADFSYIRPPPGFPPKYKRVKTETTCCNDAVLDGTAQAREPEAGMDDDKVRGNGVPTSNHDIATCYTAKLLQLESKIIKLEREMSMLKSARA